MSKAREMVYQLNAFADGDSVSEFLKLMGAKGYRQDESSCPISQWIGRGTDCPVLTEDTIKVIYPSQFGREFDEVEEFETSTAVKEFINNFDEGLYPELDIDDVDEEYGY